MPFPHERLAVYQAALRFLVFANDIVENLPRGRSHLADQLTRAATSVVLNIAEGAGKFSRPDKRRYSDAVQGGQEHPGRSGQDVDGVGEDHGGEGRGIGERA